MTPEALNNLLARDSWLTGVMESSCRTWKKEDSLSGENIEDLGVGLLVPRV